MQNVYFSFISTVLLYFITASDRISLHCPLQCLCVSPTYELALQTGKVIEQMGKYYPEVKLMYAIRGNKCKSSQLSAAMCLENGNCKNLPNLIF